MFFLCTFCKIKSLRFFCCCWFWVSTLLLYLKKLIILPKCNYSLFPLNFLHTVSTSENFPPTYFTFFTIPPPPHPTCWWCPRHLTLCQQRELDSSYDLLRVFPLCLLILSSFRVKVRFYLRKTNWACNNLSLLVTKGVKLRRNGWKGKQLFMFQLFSTCEDKLIWL